MSNETYDLIIEQVTFRIYLLLMGGRSDVQKRLQMKICSLFVFGRDIKDENFSKLVLYRYSFMEKIENKAIQKY